MILLEIRLDLNFKIGSRIFEIMFFSLGPFPTLLKIRIRTKRAASQTGYLLWYRHNKNLCLYSSLEKTNFLIGQTPLNQILNTYPKETSDQFRIGKRTKSSGPNIDRVVRDSRTMGHCPWLTPGPRSGSSVQVHGTLVECNPEILSSLRISFEKYKRVSACAYARQLMILMTDCVFWWPIVFDCEIVYK